MSVLDRFRRRRRKPFAAATDEERIARYVYLLNTLPASVIESAHATAFADLPAARRRELFEQLRPFMSESERASATDDPTALARLLRRAEEHRSQRRADGSDAGSAATTTALADRDLRDDVDPRSVMMQTGVMALMANQVLASTAVAMYFTHGAGSLHLDAEPGWVGATFDPVGSGWDAGGGGVVDGSGGGFFDGGGGFDGGGFGGGFDGGGFGG